MDGGSPGRRSSSRHASPRSDVGYASDAGYKSTGPSPRVNDDRFHTPRAMASARGANSDTEFSSPRLSARSGGGSARFITGSDNEFATPRLQTGSGRSGYNSARAEGKYDDGDESDRYLEGLQEQKQSSYAMARQHQLQQQAAQPPPQHHQQQQHHHHPPHQGYAAPAPQHYQQYDHGYHHHHQQQQQQYAAPPQQHYPHHAQHSHYAQPQQHHQQQQYYNPPTPSHPAPQTAPVYYEDPDPYAAQQHHQGHYNQGYQQHYQPRPQDHYYHHHHQQHPPQQQQQHYAESKEEQDYQNYYRQGSGGSGGHQYAAESKGGQDEYVDDKDVEDIFSYARHNRLQEVESLLDRGVPVNVRDQYGNTILSISCQNGHKRIMKCALRRGADINAVNYKGNSPLHFCFKYGFGSTLGAYLISKGADVTIRNHDGFLFSEAEG